MVQQDEYLSGMYLWSIDRLGNIPMHGPPLQREVPMTNLQCP